MMKALEKPSRLHSLLTTTLITTQSHARAERSRFVWRMSDSSETYELAALGIINGLLPADVKLVRIVRSGPDVA